MCIKSFAPLLLLAALAVPEASATTLSFDSFTAPTPYNASYPVLVDQGFAFTQTIFDVGLVFYPDRCAFECVHGQLPYIGGAGSGSVLTLSRVDNRSFTVDAFDAAKLNQYPQDSLFSADRILVDATLSDGQTLSAEFPLAIGFSTEHLSPQWHDIVAVTFRGEPAPGGYDSNYALDNLVLDAAPVPEPATVPLMLAGLVGLAAVARRRSVRTMA